MAKSDVEHGWMNKPQPLVGLFVITDFTELIQIENYKDFTDYTDWVGYVMNFIIRSRSA